MAFEKAHVKLFARSAAFDTDAAIPVFHRFIREHALDELLIDVADYKHVQDGPGLVLVGHTGDYYLDLIDGRFGLTYSRKRSSANDTGDAEDRLRETLAHAFRACLLLESAPELAGALGFSTDEILIRFPDRLLTPNEDDSYLEQAGLVSGLADRLFPAGHTLERGPGHPEMLSIRLSTKNAPPLSSLLDRVTHD